MKRTSLLLALVGMCFSLSLAASEVNSSVPSEEFRLEASAQGAPTCSTVELPTVVPDVIQLASQKCCLDDWQPGPCNPSTQKYFSLCTNACSICGTFSCVPKSTACLR